MPRTTIAGAALFAAWAGCGSPRPAAAPPAAPRPEVRAEPATCTTDQLELGVPAQVDLSCDDLGRTCHATIPVTIINHCAGAIEVGRVWGVDPTVYAETTTPHELAAGASWTIAATASREVETDVIVELVTPGFSAFLHTPTIRVVNTRRAAAAAACVVCNGDWGPHGMLGVESCNCRTRDRGRRCEDGDDCEGYCERERFVVTGRRGSPPVDIGHAVGRCSEFTDQWSCATVIPSGARKAGAGPDIRSESCVD